MRAKRYSDKELQVFLWILLPYTVALNSIVFGECVYDSLRTFFTAFGLSAVYLYSVYFVFGLVAVLIQKRFPNNNELFKRIAVMLPVFYTMNVLMITGLYAVHDRLQVTGCPTLTGNFLWAIVFGCFSTTVITFLNEALVNWNKWKASVIETEQLKNSYQKTRLLGLKGQINPHFLFNCFNSLSSLISEDQEKAEEFLDEMTKVHRYMLRGEDEQLVSVKEELRFARSYLFLIQVRFGAAIDIAVEANEEMLGFCMPPLSLQVILENIIYTNSASKSAPLKLSIVAGLEQMTIRNNVQARTSRENAAADEGLDNLIKKYSLLHVSEVNVVETETERVITLPLFRDKKQEL